MSGTLFFWLSQWGGEVGIRPWWEGRIAAAFTAHGSHVGRAGIEKPGSNPN